MARIAITGGVAEGKSTVLGYLRDAGFSVESADSVARAVFEQPETQKAVAELLDLQPPVSSDQVRARISDPSFRRALNRITHPKILAELRASRAEFIEVPLLIEACLQGEFERVWVVTCGVEEQRRRLLARLGDIASADSMIRTQLASQVKITFADFLVRTNREESTVKRCVTLAAQSELG